MSSCKANSSSAGLKGPRIVWKPKVHYNAQNRPPAFSIFSQNNIVHTLSLYFLKIYLNIILPLALSLASSYT
jgi:hypothetical protein